jgi:hypothetical protein
MAFMHFAFEIRRTWHVEFSAAYDQLTSRRHPAGVEGARGEARAFARLDNGWGTTARNPTLARPGFFLCELSHTA